MYNEHLKTGSENPREVKKGVKDLPKFVLVGGGNAFMREAALALRLAGVPFTLQIFSDYDVTYLECNGEPFLKDRETSVAVARRVREIYDFANTQAGNAGISLPQLTDIREMVEERIS